MVHIDPATDLIDIPVPLSRGRGSILIAPIDEFLHSTLFDLFIRLESEFFLDFFFDRETMTVPSPDSIDTTTTHRPVASDDVFHYR